MLLPALSLLQVVPSAQAAAAALSVPTERAPTALRVASWNVYYRALDDAFGSRAIVEAIDAANSAIAHRPFSFVSIIEASGARSMFKSLARSHKGTITSARTHGPLLGRRCSYAILMVFVKKPPNLSKCV